LLVNAIKFTPDGGAIGVEAELSDQQMILTVTDSGVGISEDFLPHVFERFRQADPSATRSQGGLGLGLAIVRRLVELHGGAVHAASPGPGRGASFTVRLPVAVEEQSAAAVFDGPPMALPQEDRPIHDVRVLLVEDDLDGREMVDQLLTDHGGTVTGVASAAQALAALRDGLFDVVVSDIGMPGMDGYELLRRIRDGGNPIPAIALSAFARAEDKAKALAAGYDCHISKPVEPPALIAAVANVARCGR
jgi:CheY-like chemotaxis protein